jgi:3-phenylpropionate/trans-cinnamate dioxygenase ferredoxin reductase subunit
VIVGGGAAGAATVAALRDGAYAEPITLIGAEAELPYDRPPLSKGYLQGKSGLAEVFLHDLRWYDQRDVRLLVGSAVSEIDLGSRQVKLGPREAIGYDQLVLATGATPQRPDLPGADLPGVLCLRTLADSDRLRDRMAEANRVVVIGGGWIGLEVTAAARAVGLPVTVLETAPLPLMRVLGEWMAPVFADLHRKQGVDLRVGVEVSAITGDRFATGVRLADGTRLSGDLIVLGVGATANTQLAQRAGITVEDGIRTDAGLRTSAPDVYAVGDVARADHPLYGCPLRVEHWDNAHHQPETAAAAILGRRAVHDAVPYFFTDQYDLGMEYGGYLMPDRKHRVVVRGDLAGREFIAFWQDPAGRLVAGMNVNVWDVNDTIRALIAERRPLDRDRLADPGVPLTDLFEPGRS